MREEGRGEWKEDEKERKPLLAWRILLLLHLLSWMYLQTREGEEEGQRKGELKGTVIGKKKGEGRKTEGEMR
jgi:hypothetical protein